MDNRYVSPLNRDVKPAAAGEFPPLAIGALEIWPPVVLAPMAGITNYPFRSLCREFGAGLCVSEMITARALVERNAKTLKLSHFSSDEKPRSLQLYGVDPHYVGEAVAYLVGENRVDHIDMNFGCPVRKVTRRGGGAALPAKPRLLARILRSAVRRAGSVPVTVKFRIGIDDAIQTFRDAGRAAEQEGCRAVALHARTAAQLYSGDARWEAIAELKRIVETIPVLGNGDIWEPWDALRMMRATGCDGVVVGRGCLGRPWLFRDLADVFEGRPPRNPPRFGDVVDIMLRHATRLAEWFGEEHAIRSFRRQSVWYTKGLAGSSRLREKLIRVTTLAELAQVVSEPDPELEFPPAAIRMKRGKSGGSQRVSLPKGYLDDLEDATPPGPEAEETASGG